MDFFKPNKQMKILIKIKIKINKIKQIQNIVFERSSKINLNLHI